MATPRRRTAVNRTHCVETLMQPLIPFHLPGFRDVMPYLVIIGGQLVKDLFLTLANGITGIAPQIIHSGNHCAD